MSSAQTLNILMIGDIVARPGRTTVREYLPTLIKEDSIDLVIANVENAAGGKGITQNIAKELVAVGVDVMTSGDHVDARDGWQDVLNDESLPIIRPYNYESTYPGRGTHTIEVNGKKITVINFQGLDGMHRDVSNEFLMFDAWYEEHKDEQDFIVIDFHAEYTSEKKAFGLFLDGRAHIVSGTHTHVPTADQQILTGGTAFVTDLGMVGVNESVLGVKKDIIISRYKDGDQSRFEWEYSGATVFNSVLFRISENGFVEGVTRRDAIIP